MLLLDVVPLSLGIETMGGVMTRLIERNTTIPTSHSETFTTAVDNQTAVDLHVLQGEREIAKDCRSLARFSIPIEPATAGFPRVDVVFMIDANGILNVTARDVRTGRERSLDVKPSYGLTDEEVERMLEESIDFAEEDVAARLLAESRTEAATLVRQIVADARRVASAARARRGRRDPAGDRGAGGRGGGPTTTAFATWRRVSATSVRRSRTGSWKRRSSGRSSTRAQEVGHGA